MPPHQWGPFSPTHHFSFLRRRHRHRHQHRHQHQSQHARQTQRLRLHRGLGSDAALLLLYSRPNGNQWRLPMKRKEGQQHRPWRHRAAGGALGGAERSAMAMGASRRLHRRGRSGDDRHWPFRKTVDAVAAVGITVAPAPAVVGHKWPRLRQQTRCCAPPLRNRPRRRDRSTQRVLRQGVGAPPPAPKVHCR